MRRHEITLLVTEGKESEKKYNWVDAAEVYRKASDLMLKEKEYSRAAEFWERIGLCYSLASRQASSVEEFKKLRQLAVEAYERAAELFKEENQGKAMECLAISEYTRSWIASNAAEKKKILDKCRALGKEALEAFKKIGDELNYGKTCNVLLWCLHDRMVLTYTGAEGGELLKRATDDANPKFPEAPDFIDVEIAREAMGIADNAISVLSKLEQKDELLLTFSLASIISCDYAAFTGQQEERGPLTSRCLDYVKETVALHEGISNPYFKAVALWAEAISNIFLTRNFELSLKKAKEMLQQASIVRDNYLLGRASHLVTFATIHMFWRGDWYGDPDKEKQQSRELTKVTKDTIRYNQLVCQDATISGGYIGLSAGISQRILGSFAFNELEKARALSLGKKAVEIGEKGLEHSIRSGSVMALRSSLNVLSMGYYAYAKLEPRKEEKTELLKTAISYRKESIKTNWKNPNLWTRGIDLVGAAQIETDLAILEEDEKNKSNRLRAAISNMEEGITYLRQWVEYETTPFLITFLARNEDQVGGMLTDRYFITRDKENLTKANAAYENAAKNFQKVDSPNRLAECYWKIAKNLDQIGEHQKAAKNFKNAFVGYNVAAQKLPQLRDFCLNYANYMEAWSEIETAKQAHKNEKYSIAKQHYEKASSLLKRSKMWNYLAPNFTAWSILEQAEDLSRKEDTHEAIRVFQQAMEEFTKAEKTVQNKIKEITEADEKEMATELIKASETRLRYCQARISIEEAKILDRKGEYDLSSESYGIAAENLRRIIEEIGSEASRQELRLIMTLCLAWQKMALAEEKTSPKMYLEASQLFEEAKEYSLTKRTSLLALGNSSFCKALATGTTFEVTLDVALHSEATRYIESAATCYLKAGFQTASEYAKATQRLFDAYVYMSNAGREIDPDKKAKYYQMAEKVLQISAGSFMRAKQPEKTAEVQRILETVRGEKALAVSLKEVLHAPAIASTTLSFAIPTPTSEVSVGLERFESADVQANLICNVQQVRVGESFTLNVEFVNAGKQSALITKLEDIIPNGFVVVDKPEIYRLEGNSINMKGKQLQPLKVIDVKLVLQSLRKGEYRLRPKAIYLDELGKSKSLQLKTVEIKIEEIVLADRVSTGTKELDSLLLGGIPQGYAVALAGPPSDERELIIKNFLEAGIKQDQITFQVTAEPTGLDNLLEKAGFYLFLCNPKPKVEVPDLPNIHKLSSKTDLNNLNIALTVASRSLDKKLHGPKRVCMEIISDVLIRHQIEVTQRWISGLIADMGSKGFTLLAVMDPSSHPHDQANAILNLFDGIINLFETETAIECKTSIQIKRLRNQDYIKNPICMAK